MKIYSCKFANEKRMKYKMGKWKRKKKLLGKKRKGKQIKE